MYKEDLEINKEEPFYNGGKSLLIGACFDANNI